MANSSKLIKNASQTLSSKYSAYVESASKLATFSMPLIKICDVRVLLCLYGVEITIVFIQDSFITINFNFLSLYLFPYFYWERLF